MPYNVLPRLQGKTVEEIRASIKRFPFSVASFNVQYGINVGSILRACNVFAASQYINIGHKQWDRRASLGVQNYENIVYVPTWNEFLIYSKENNLTPIGIDYVDGISIPLQTIQTWKDIHPVFIFGSERGGLPQEAIKDCQRILHIEQFGSIPSMNVAQAAAIVMNSWHDCRRNSDAG